MFSIVPGTHHMYVLFIYFLERGERRDIERERNIDM